MTCGEVVLVHYPFTDATGSKLRPALIVSADAFNKGDDRILVPISSALDLNDAHALPIKEADADFCGTGLKRSSWIKWTKPLTLSRRVITRRLGSLPSPRLNEIRARVRSLFE